MLYFYDGACYRDIDTTMSVCWSESYQKARIILFCYPNLSLSQQFSHAKTCRLAWMPDCWCKFSSIFSETSGTGNTRKMVWWVSRCTSSFNIALANWAAASLAFSKDRSLTEIFTSTCNTQKIQIISLHAWFTGQSMHSYSETSFWFKTQEHQDAIVRTSKRPGQLRIFSLWSNCA